METQLKISETSRCGRRRQRKREKKHPSRNSSSPFRQLGLLSKRISRKNVRKKLRLSHPYLSNIVQGLYEEIPLNQDEKKEPTECLQPNTNVFEQTIDLSDGESLSEIPSSSISLGLSENKEPKEATEIDLSNDLSGLKEVIDLTESNQPGNNVEPTVIDISDEVSKEESVTKSDNDDIHVIGIFTNHCNFFTKKRPPDFIPLSNKFEKLKNLSTCSEILKNKYLKKHSVFDKIHNFNNNGNRKNKKQKLFKENSFKMKKSPEKFGGNIYINSPVNLPSSGLRPIIIDGSNVAHVRSSCKFSCKRLEICINYFKEKGHKVIAFVPQFRIKSHKSDNPNLLRKLEKQGDVILTPSKEIDGKNIVPYDDRFIVQTAVLKGGIIVTRDNYNDLLNENPTWAETIKYRTLAFTWVDDVLMFPKDPLGEFGPSLEEFLRFH